MKNMLKVLGIVMLVLIIAFGTASCGTQRVKIDTTPDRDSYYDEIEAESRNR